MTTEKEFLGTSEELSGAPAQIMEALAFIWAQGGKMSSQDGLVMNSDFQSLGCLVEDSFVTQKYKEHFAALLQQSADAQKDSRVHGGQGRGVPDRGAQM